MVELADTLA